MRSGFNLPPLMFDPSEPKALLACVRIAQARLDPELAIAAALALHKLIGVLPASVRAVAESMALHAPVSSLDAATRMRLQTMRKATKGKHKLALSYLDLNDDASERTVRPLGCFYRDAVWVLAAWCELATASATFASTASKRSTLATSRAKRWPICFEPSASAASASATSRAAGTSTWGESMNA